MPDLTISLLPELRATRLPDLPLPDDLQAPAYGGHSILNLPGTVARALGAGAFGAAPLAVPGLDDLAGGAKRVILLLMDSLALHRFQAWLPDNPFWARLLQDGLLAPLTSISPSTTSAALTALWSGAPAARHGVTGYEMWLREYTLVANMISHYPIAYQKGGGDLTHAGFEPLEFLSLPTLDGHLAGHGIPTYVFQHFAIIHSNLSRMLSRQAERRAIASAADLCISLRDLLESQPGAPLYAWVYWSEVDHLSHRHGPDDARPRAEFAHFTHAFERFFFNDLSPAARKDTLFLLAADHGGITVPNGDPHYMLSSHPNLARRVLVWAGENRLPFLYVRPGQLEAVREYIEKTWRNQFVVLESANALHAGLFGPPPFHEEILNRIGDLVLLPRNDAFLWWHNREDWLVGRHGGLHPEEMLVPLLAARLG
ncbi:MAG: alkaline phosphatase family protein [Chloroflexi bacterium]|nr:alkaline phosphatase family protein [Chloroflexota bacterium]